MLEKKIIVNEALADELADLVAEKVLEKLDNHIQDYLSHKYDKPLTVAEASEYLGVDKSTLYLWGKKGKITCHGIGGRRYYFKKELLKVLEKNSLRTNEK